MLEATRLKQRPVCMDCDHRFDIPPNTFFIGIPFINPTAAIMAMGICDDCAAKPDLHARAKARIRELWPLATFERAQPN